VVLFGEASKLIESELLGYEKGQRSYPLAIEESFEDAVMKAAELAISGECVLLSPGGTSYDAYRDFEERGDHFRSLVEELA
jgi:UDP-N-acetylmuramoylalanine--D-glutamate ligase